MTLYIIAGHGAGDPGAGGTASDGKHYDEAERVRTLANSIAAKGGSNVVVLDTKRNWYADKGINAALKQLVGNNPLIELHMDAADGNGPAKGGHVVIKEGMQPDAYDKALAAFISGRFPGRSNAIVGRANLGNVNRAASNGINYRLLECGMIDDKRDLDVFNANVDAIAEGILRAFGITPKTSGKKEPAVTQSKPTQPTSSPRNSNGLYYRGHSAKAGWLTPVHDGQTAGTTGFKVALEALKIDARKCKYKVEVDVSLHIQGIGDKTFKNVSHDTVIGTTGESKRIEGIIIDVRGLPQGVHLRYRVHVQGSGWSEWVTEGDFLGTIGESKRIEAIQMYIA